MKEDNMEQTQIEMPQDLKDFIKNSNWVWAKTYEKFAPHWWCVRNNGNYETFNKLIIFIREKGVCRKWHTKIGMYLDYDGHSYWTMGGDLKHTTIINRKIINPNDKNDELPKEEYLNMDKFPEVEEKILEDVKNPQRKLF
jgi:hypothetical protein